MAMFDFIQSDFPMPYSKFQNDLFYTKAFSRLLRIYTILEDGRILAHHETIEPGMVESKVNIPSHPNDSFVSFDGIFTMRDEKSTFEIHCVAGVVQEIRLIGDKNANEFLMNPDYLEQVQWKV